MATYYQQGLTAIGKFKQDDIATGLASAQMICLPFLEGDPLSIKPIWESNLGEPGTGSPYATGAYKKNIEAGKNFGARMCSEWLAMLLVHGIGNFTKAAYGSNGGIKYSGSVPTDFSSLGDNVMFTSICEQQATGHGDELLVGCALDSFTLRMQLGTARDAAKITANWIGSGRYTTPSSIVIPALTTTHDLNIGGATVLELCGVNYYSNARLNWFELTVANSLVRDSNYTLGGGQQSGFWVMGRIRRRPPAITLKANVEIADGTAETVAMLAGTLDDGTITVLGDRIGQSGSEYHGFKLFFHQLRVLEALRTRGEADQLMFDVTFSVEQDANSDLLDYEVYTELDDVGSEVP
jgi:hypothetical protein